jgi:hypothetical protein
LRSRVDLHLVANTLKQLNDSAYFEQRLHEFTRHLIGAIEHVLDNPGKYDAAVEETFAKVARSVQSYLSGSTNNEVPYEVVYCLTDALKRWKLSEAVIVTFLTEDRNAHHDFHLRNSDPWLFIEAFITDYDPQGFKLPLVMIGVPRIYAHKPVFCVPLFHELGHFVDHQHSVSAVSMIQNSNLIGPQNGNELSHRREYFADLFAACFVGRSSIAALEAIAPNVSSSLTHPATADRAALVDAFLAGGSHPIIDLVQNALQALQLPTLTPIFQRVEVGADYDDIRTFVPASMEQVYGLFDSAWNYLFDAIDNNRNPWNFSSAKDGDIEVLTNDLTEKSIRNFAIRQAWDVASTGS